MHVHDVELQQKLSLPVFIQGTLPAQCDGVGLAVSDGEISYTEGWRQNSTLENDKSDKSEMIFHQ